jgi:ABC-type polysaccharide/polyol phosphate transport system ATPase subunit
MLLRIQLALAIAERREALVIDEVLAAADGEYRAWATGQIRAQADDGAAVLIASHDAALTRSLAQRVVVLERGAVAFSGPVSEGLTVYKQLGKAKRG